MPLKAVIFDLGGTLVEYAGPYKTWPDLETPGFTAAYQHLQKHGLPLPDLHTFMHTGFGIIPQKWQAATKGEANLRLVDLLVDTLHACQVPNGDMRLLAEAAALYEQAICAQAEPVPNGQTVLAALKQAGLKLGLLSNTMFAGAAHEADLRRFGLRPYFDALLFSADAGVWKPQPEPFLQVAEALGVEPETAVYVGDDPGADVVGAVGAGMRAVHFQSSQRFAEAAVPPTAVIHTLPELLPLVQKWQAS